MDGKPQLSTTKKPFTAELRLERYPTEQTVRAEGYDAEGKLVVADEVILNQPRGALNVRIVSPSKGTKVEGKTKARAEVVVPDGRRVKSMDFRINDETVASLTVPPWEAEVTVPPNAELVYLTVVVTLDDDTTTEAVRYLKSPEFFSEVEVNLVELYVAVTDRSGTYVTNLTPGGFRGLRVGEEAGDRQVRAGPEPAAHARHPARHFGVHGRLHGGDAEGGLRLPRKHHAAQGPRLRRELRPPAEPGDAAHG